MTTPITVAAARTLLTAEGNTPDDVATAIDSLYSAGFAIPAAQQLAAYDRNGKPLAEGDTVFDFRGRAVKFVRISRGSTESGDAADPWSGTRLAMVRALMPGVIL